MAEKTCTVLPRLVKRLPLTRSSTNYAALLDALDNTTSRWWVSRFRIAVNVLTGPVYGQTKRTRKVGVTGKYGTVSIKRARVGSQVSLTC